jgi:hypothetical protein
LEQRRALLVLQTADAAADGRFLDAERNPGFAVAAIVGGQEIAQVAKLYFTREFRDPPITDLRG